MHHARPLASARANLLELYGLLVDDDHQAATLLASLASADARPAPDRRLDLATRSVRAMTALDFTAPLLEHGSDSMARHCAALELLRRVLRDATVPATHLASVLDAMPLVVLVVEVDGVVREANRRAKEHFGGVWGRPLSDFLPALNLDDTRSGRTTIEVALEKSTLLFSIGAIRGSDGRMNGWICVGTDISAQTRAKAALEHARQLAEDNARARAAFLANTSHEIRTPLHGIVGAAALLAEEDLPDSQRPLVEAIVGCGRHLSELIDDVLDLARIDAGALSLEREPFSPRELFETATTLVAGRAAEKGLDLQIAVDDSVPERVRGDVLRVRQILVNLLGNAVKFTRIGFVRLSATWDGELRLRIDDSGIGIPVERQARLFQNFTQADDRTSREYGGTGLGLAISAKVAELMGGAIALASEPGLGTTVEVRLPLPEVSVHPRPVDHPAEQLPEQLRVLVVDDNAVNRMVACRILERMGVAHEAVEGGDEALRLLDARHFGVVLMDCHMPGVDGLEATRRLRRREALRESAPAVVIALTASAMSDERTACFDAGMNDFLSKPVNQRGLRKALLRWSGD